MQNNTLIHNAKPNFISNSTIIGAALGFLLLILGWFTCFIFYDVSITLKGLWALHAAHPVLYILDILPFLAGFLAYHASSQYLKRKEYFQQEINKRDEKINKNVEFAQKIGEGNYEVEIDIDESDVLGNSLLVMRDNLLKNYKKELEENWISQGKDLISDILRSHNKIEDVSYDVLVNLVKYAGFIQGAFYVYNDQEDVLTNTATYAYNRKKILNQEFKIGYGLIGACAYEKEIIYRTEIPEDYVTITSGLVGEKKPRSLLIVPLLSNEKIQGIIEFASVREEIEELTVRFMKEMAEIIGQTIFNLKVNQQTERLLLESRQKTKELQEGEEQLRKNAEEMQITQEELKISNDQLESKIKEVKIAQNRLHSLLENAFEIIYIYGQDKKLTYVSPSVNNIIGFSTEEIKGGKDQERLTKKGKKEFNEMLDALLSNPQRIITKQYAYLKKDGTKIFLETTGRNLLNDPSIQGIIFNSRDITARVRAEKEERMRSRMQSLSENSLDMIIRFSIDGECYYANPVVKDFLHMPPETMVNKHLSNLSIPEVFSNYFDEAIRKIKEDPVKQQDEFSVNTGHQDENFLQIININAIPEFNESELETILFIGHDITEAKRIEREIQQKNQKIEDSINYAQRIQSSILPTNKSLHETFPDSFIFYKPKDVVSGDFPWMLVKENIAYIAAVDCTGHGVPGALLSFIAYFTLNNIVDHDPRLTAGEICDTLHYRVRSALNQDKPDAYARDGMDIAFCKIDTTTMEMHYCGAHRPLYLLRNSELQEYKGDKKAIGGIPHFKKKEEKFTNHIIQLNKKDKIFFFSDGLTDQYGGPDNKKYSPKRIRETLIAHPDFSMTQYMNYFEKDFNKWVGNKKQIDDVLLIGIAFD
jgi:PAS domain S-box-containing protein